MALESRLNNPGLSQTLHHGADYSTLLVGLMGCRYEEKRVWEMFMECDIEACTQNSLGL